MAALDYWGLWIWPFVVRNAGGIDVVNGQEGKREVRVGQAESEREPWLNAFAIEGAIVNVEAFGEVVLGVRVGACCGVQEVAVIALLFGDGEGEVCQLLVLLHRTLIQKEGRPFSF